MRHIYFCHFVYANGSTLQNSCLCASASCNFIRITKATQHQPLAVMSNATCRTHPISRYWHSRAAYNISQANRQIVIMVWIQLVSIIFLRLNTFVRFYTFSLSECIFAKCNVCARARALRKKYIEWDKGACPISISLNYLQFWRLWIANKIYTYTIHIDRRLWLAFLWILFFVFHCFWLAEFHSIYVLVILLRNWNRPMCMCAGVRDCK